MRASFRSFAGRLLVVVSLALSGTPALAEPLQQAMDAQLRASELQAQQDQAARQAALLQNQLTVLEAQIRAQQAIADIRAQSQTPRLPAPPLGGVPPNLDTSRLASIPDSKLAESNARVKAAAANHR